MRIAALSDIHSNYVALKACLDYIYSNDFYGIAFLGDYVTDCAYPQKTLEILRNIPQKYKTWFIKGNREDYMISYHDNPDDNWKYCSADGSLLYTYKNLNENDIAFFRSMLISMDIKINGMPEFTICHGTPYNNRTVLHPDNDIIDDVVHNMKNALLICGHGHQPFIYHKNGKKIISGGAVGVPCNHQNCAQFSSVSYHDNEWHTETVTVPYDIQKMISDIDESGLADKAPIWAKAIKYQLQTGRNISYECACMVGELSKESGLDYNTESLWLKAASILQLT